MFGSSTPHRLQQPRALSLGSGYKSQGRLGDQQCCLRSFADRNKKMPAMKHVSAFESWPRRTVMVELRHNIVLQVVFSTLATSYCTAWNSNQTLVCPRRVFYGLCRRFSAIYFVLQGNISRHFDVILTVVIMSNDALPVYGVNDN